MTCPSTPGHDEDVPADKSADELYALVPAEASVPARTEGGVIRPLTEEEVEIETEFLEYQEQFSSLIAAFRETISFLAEHRDELFVEGTRAYEVLCATLYHIMVAEMRLGNEDGFSFDGTPLQGQIVADFDPTDHRSQPTLNLAEGVDSLFQVMNAFVGHLEASKARWRIFLTDPIKYMDPATLTMLVRDQQALHIIQRRSAADRNRESDPHPGVETGPDSSPIDFDDPFFWGPM